ncbi:mitochondrial fission ELM1 family protein [Marinicella sp. W31]|uniref:mitochondrial fission ELM1 family protein n=1 Tax=Marinicella sp. W31 TaxID=3023713 RepID=UPI003756D075
MNKVNLCWVLSDGLSGHEIQSLSIAHEISHTIKLHAFTLKPLWKSMTPRRLPFFNQAIQWQTPQPDFESRPNIIVTCGKTAAAVGKHCAEKIAAQHIQILNPKDNLKNYDLLLIPEHDQRNGSNVITTQGSLHNFNSHSLQRHQRQSHDMIDTLSRPLLAVFLGNPGKAFFTDFESHCQQLVTTFPKHSIFVCGSRRIPTESQHQIRILAQTHGFTFWLDQQDGDNPYQKLLATADYFVISGDSINMVSEACATDKPVSVIACDYVSEKHRRFVQSLKERVVTFGHAADEKYQPLQTMQNTLQHPLMRALIKKAAN